LCTRRAEPRASIMPINWTQIDVENLSGKKDADEKKKLLEASAEEISVSVGEWEEKSHGEDSGTEDDDSEDESEKLARKAARFEEKKKKLQKRAGKGAVDKLEKKMKKYQEKADKAASKGKSDAYVNYKKSKVEYIKVLMKTARLINNMRSAGLM